MRTSHGNLIRFTSFGLLAAGVTFAASAHSQVVIDDSQIPNHLATPSLEQCTMADKGLVPGIPKRTVMFTSLHPLCGKVLADEMERRSQSASLRPMYMVDSAHWPANLASTTPNQLIEGVFDAFVESDVRVDNNTQASYGGVMLAHTNPVGSSLIHTRSPKQAIAHRAHPEWEATGTGLTDSNNPCGEWVWKGYYEYSRFEDAAAACGNDDECVYQVAYSSTTGAPGIAHRSHFRSLDQTGRYFRKSMPMSLVSGAWSKNMFFGSSPAFLLDQQQGLLEDLLELKLQQPLLLEGKSVALQAGPKNYSCAGNFRFRNPASKYYVDPADAAASTKLARLDQDLQAVSGLLKKKATYLVKPTNLQKALYPQAETFLDEWYYHRVMHDRQKPTGGEQGQPLSKAERRAIDERTKSLQHLIERYAMITSPRLYGNNSLPVDVNYRNPLDEALSRVVNPTPDERIVVDPFLRSIGVSSMRGDMVEPHRVASLEAQGAVVTNQMLVPFNVGGGGAQPLTPFSNTNAVTNLDKDSVTTLVGVERNYGKAQNVVEATVGASNIKCPDPEEEAPRNADAYELARSAQKVQEQIVELLVDEYHRGEHGCLSEEGYNCDWSPLLFSQRFMGRFTQEREEAFQYCVQMTGGNTLDHQDHLFRVHPTMREMNRFPDHLEFVKKELDAQLEGLPYLKVSESDHRVGETVSGGQSFGDMNWFGAGYDYKAEWSISPKFKDKAKPHELACAFHGDANAEFNAKASVMGKQIVIARADANGTARANGSDYNIDIEFLGKSFHSSSGKEHFHYVDTNTRKTDPVSATVVVVVVPVTFQAFGEVQYGYELEAKVESNDECGKDSPLPQMNMTMQVQPFAKVNAVASAGVGISGAQAGVRGRIALLDTRLPVKANMLVKHDSGTIKLFPSASADFSVSALSGSMSVFAEVSLGLAKYTAEKDIFSWRGVGDTIPLWKLESDPVYLSAFSKGGWEEWLSVYTKK